MGKLSARGHLGSSLLASLLNLPEEAKKYRLWNFSDSPYRHNIEINDKIHTNDLKVLIFISLDIK